jgi:hypothetical protein
MSTRLNHPHSHERSSAANIQVYQEGDRLLEPVLVLAPA